MNHDKKNVYLQKKLDHSWWMESDFYEALRREEPRIRQQPLWWNPSTYAKTNSPLTKRVK